MREAGADGPLGLVLVRPRPAEVGQHAVAHELGDVALEPGDLAGDGVLVGADDLAHLLRVEPGRERGRADQVDEHDRELAALGLGRPPGCGGGPGAASSAAIAFSSFFGGRAAGQASLGRHR